jgi:hypothetical protein
MEEEAGNLEAFWQSIERLSDRLGPLWTLFAVLVVVLLPTAVSLWRERHLRKAYERTISSQDNEIKRLAEDNKAWREHFFQQHGISEAAISKLESPSKPGKGKPKK